MDHSVCLARIEVEVDIESQLTNDIIMYFERQRMEGSLDNGNIILVCQFISAVTE